MISEYDERIALRLTSKQLQKINKIVKSGTFKNLSHVVRTALEEFFEKRGS